MITLIVGLIIGFVGGVVVGRIYQKKINAVITAGTAVVNDVKKI